MSGTSALAEFDEYLNDLYNYYIDEGECEFAEMVYNIRVELDKLYDTYFVKGD